MSDIDPDKCGLSTLLTFVPEDRHKEVIAYVRMLMCDSAYQADIDETFLGFLCDYINYADLLHRKLQTHGYCGSKPPITIVDVGCATALQHLIFDSRIHYIGIDGSEQPEPRFFRPNCAYIQGHFRGVVDKIDVHSECYGIANMSLYYGPEDDLALFDRTFKRKFVL